MIDVGPDLDTGCVFSGSGPLIIDLPISRVVSTAGASIEDLVAAGLIDEFAILEMPVFDVDFDGGQGQVSPERDRITLNGQVLTPEFLRGRNETWIRNRFEVPVGQLRFPEDPGPGGTAQPVNNRIVIDIDVANPQEVWCTAVDWVALTLEVARPVVMVHGIFSSGATWDQTPFSWVQELDSLGLPNSNALNMGDLDSIQDNAVEIRQEIAAARQRWGVDKVNIVAHSKGGIDSRHHVVRNDDVDQLIQLGTPNAGSPLADVAQAGAVASTGLAGSILINRLAGPAGVQLTTRYMALYNLTQGFNPAVAYTALAGDYDPDCPIINPTCRPIERLFLSITGPGDTIVPITSVHALGYTNDLTLASSGADLQATHTRLTRSNRVYNEVSDQVSQKLATAEAGALKNTGSTVTTTASVVANIAQDEVQNQSIPIDEASPTFFSLMYESGDLDITLTSPSGVIIDPTTAANDPNIGFQESDILGGRMAVYNLLSPEVGVWTATVTGASIPVGLTTLTYSLNAWIENASLILTAGIDNASVQIGEPVVLSATVSDGGTPVIDATAEVIIALPDDTSTTVALNDTGTAPDDAAGDGIYTGQFTGTNAAGTYRALFSASRTGVVGSPDFSREQFEIFTVRTSSTDTTGSFSDSGVDTNGNGLFDELLIQVAVNVTVTGQYRLRGVLTDSAGNSLEGGFEGVLQAGTNSITLSFDGREIFLNGVDGPYDLSLLVFSEINEDNIFLIDDLEMVYQTGAYSFRAFERDSILLDETITETPVFNDMEEITDLVFSLQVDVLEPGPYQWSGLLTDLAGNEVAIGSGSGNLVAGLNTIELAFPGPEIRSSGIDGPYCLRDVSVFNETVSFSAPPGCIATSAAYGADEFAAAPPPSVVTPTPVAIPTLAHSRMLILFALLVVLGGFYLSRRPHQQ